MTPTSLVAFCHRRSPRCDDDPESPRFRYSSYGADTPLCCASHLVETTFALTTLLEARAIPYFILWGTHLGAVRHGGLIPWDTDVDIGVFDTDVPRVAELGGPLSAKGFCLRDTPEKGCLTLDYSATNHLHVDIYPWRRDGGSFVWEEHAIAERDLLPLRGYPFHGRMLPGPNGLGYLLDYYGADCLTHGRKQWLGWGTRLFRPGPGSRFSLSDLAPAPIDLDRDFEAENLQAGLLRRAGLHLARRVRLWKLRAWWAVLRASRGTR